MIYADGNIFLLQTENTSYLFRKLSSGHLEHVHYGASLFAKDADIKGNIEKVTEAVARYCKGYRDGCYPCGSPWRKCSFRR